jgi:hypothetical protein
MNPRAISELDSAPMKSAARAELSLTVDDLEPCSVKCSVVRTVRSACGSTGTCSSRTRGRAPRPTLETSVVIVR